MKKLLLSAIAMFSITAATFAQSETVTDTIPPISLDGYKNFDGFLLDMGPMMIAPPPLISPHLYYQPYKEKTAINYNERFNLDRNITYDRGTYHAVFGPMYRQIPTLQSATFKLANGLRLTTFGEYDANGYKVHNPGALPWEKNNFNGAFEMKSENGNFGIRIEVQKGRNAPY